MNSIISSSKIPSTYVKEWSNLESIKKIQYNRLGHTDMFVSLISFGAAHVGRGININNNDDDDGGNNQIEISNISPKVIDAICQAIRLGINLVDTSPFYGMGLSEIIVGQVTEKKN